MYYFIAIKKRDKIVNIFDHHCFKQYEDIISIFIIFCSISFLLYLSKIIIFINKN